MSLIELYPTKWAVNETWNKVKIYGIMQNNKSVYAEIPFLPYLIVDYENMDTTNIDNLHNILLTDSRAFEINGTVVKNVFQINCLNKEDYEITRSDFIRLCTKNAIVGDKTSMLTKYFIYSNINPGAWKILNRIQNNFDKINTNTNFSNCDYEFHAHEITDSNNIGRPNPKYVFFDIATVSCNKFTSETDEIVAISLLIDKTTHILKIGSPVAQLFPNTVIHNLSSEKEICETFFTLFMFPLSIDYLITYGNCLTNLIKKCQIHRIKIPNFSKEKGRSFVLGESKSFVSIPGVTFVDLKLYITKMFPHCSDLTLNDATLRFLDQNSGENTLQGLLLNTINMQKLWEKLDILQNISRFINFWKIDVETILSKTNKKLFKNLSLYFGFKRKQKFDIGELSAPKIKSGIYHNVYIYSLSKIYVKLLDSVIPSTSTFGQNTYKYFKDTNMIDGPFKSKLFPVNFSSIQDNLFIKQDCQILWMDENIIAIATSSPRTNDGPLKLTLFDFYKTIVIVNTGQIRVDAVGHRTKVGMSMITNPPFLLLQKFIDLLIAKASPIVGSIKTSITSISLPEITPTLEDLELIMKFTSYDYESERINMLADVNKKMIITQMLESGIETNCRWHQVKYIMTINGPVIDYFVLKSGNPTFYLNKINIEYYKQQLLAFKQKLL